MAVLTISGKSVVVDDDDVQQLSHYYWVVEKRGVMEYARGTPKGKHDSRPKKVYMHRVILGAKEGEEIDHKNRDGLDNSRSNLRIATRSQNGHNKVKPCNNTSGSKGVYFSKERGKWFAKIVKEGRGHKRGYFADIQDAVNAYADLQFEIIGSLARVDSDLIIGT